MQKRIELSKGAPNNKKGIYRKEKLTLVSRENHENGRDWIYME
jgi:hypothetical protein